LLASFLAMLCFTAFTWLMGLISSNYSWVDRCV
jgi:hypothetical protein